MTGQLFVIQEAENEISSVSAERDKAFSELQDALVKHEKELSARYLFLVLLQCTALQLMWNNGRFM